MSLLSLLSLLDWVAVLFLFSGWGGYAWFARFWGERGASLLFVSNKFRREWMRQCTLREPRMLDGVITQSQSASPSFFASTSILIIGGLLAMLGTIDRANELVRDIPFVQQTSLPVFEFKIVVLLALFIYSFFRFSWSLRQYLIVGVVIGAMPHADRFAAGEHDRERHAQRAGELLGLAADTFNAGLRAYYFSFAVISWFFSPQAFMLATVCVIAILYVREFHSDVRRVLSS